MPEGRLSVTADREVCIGSGVCVMYASASFAQDEQGKVVLLDPAGDPDEAVRTAVEGCPTGALRIDERGA